jgi:glycosyltransferase involved in cell wall biosynthesis
LDKSEQVKSPSPDPAGLRILLIVNLNWDARLGAVRVFLELAEAWRAAGHTVEKYSLSDAFPGTRGAGALFAFRQVLFPFKAAAFLKRNAARFDVVDALIGSLHGSKQRLRFTGLLVARSVGLYRLYEKFERGLRDRQSQSQGKLLGKIFYTWIGRRSRRGSDNSVRHADLINVPNEEEAECLRSEAGADLAIVVQPYGLSAARCHALAAAASPSPQRLAAKTISFVGMWAPRKGSRDWAAIVRQVWHKIPEARFCFLGTMVDPRTVLADLGIRSSERIKCVTEYSQADLPNLLADCAAGAFPSYVEGFGIAVLEQMAAAIPTVAFDVAGPRDILGPGLSELLVAPGNVEKFVESLVCILNSDVSQYQELAHRSMQRARQFIWSDIARETAGAYRTYLAAVDSRSLQSHDK